LKKLLKTVDNIIKKCDKSLSSGQEAHSKGIGEMYTIEFLLSYQAEAPRAARSKTGCVVHVECRGEGPERFQELDADNVDHGLVLANSWVQNGAAVSAAVRRKLPNGELLRPSYIV
jgi:hypothetical protein